MVSFGFHLPNYVVLNSVHLTCDLPPRPLSMNCIPMPHDVPSHRKKLTGKKEAGELTSSWWVSRYFICNLFHCKSMPVTCGLPPHPSSMNYNPHMPSRRAFPWEQLKRKKRSRTIDLSHGKFWTFLFAQLFHCNLTSLTCNLPLPNTTNHTPQSRHKKSNRKINK